MTGSAGSANLGLYFDVLARVSTNYVAWFWYRCFGPPVEPYVDSVHEEVNRNIDIMDVFVLNNMVLCTNYTYWHVIFYSIFSFLWLLYLIHIVLSDTISQRPCLLLCDPLSKYSSQWADDFARCYQTKERRPAARKKLDSTSWYAANVSKDRLQGLQKMWTVLLCYANQYKSGLMYI